MGSVFEMVCGWRRAAVANSFEELLRLRGRVLFLSRREVIYPWRRVEPNKYRSLLGTEWDSAIIDLDSAPPANAIPAVVETVKAGGTVAFLKTRDLRSVYRERGGTGLFGLYLENALKELPNVESCPEWRPPTHLTREQRQALRKFERLLVGRGRYMAVIGDRGRGKSALLGAMAVTAITSGIRRVEITAPSPEQVRSAYKMVEKLLREKRARYRVERLGEEWRFLGPSWRIEWVPPDKAGRGGITLIDEAAAMGLARVRRILSRAWKAVISTTVHGYEGSGRAIVHELLSKLKDLILVELREPVRYAPNDPMERWLYQVFHLDAEPEASEPGEVREVNRETLTDPRAMRPYASLLAYSHYRWEPSDVELILEHPNLRLFEVEGPVAIAVVVREERTSPLGRFFNVNAWRIMRIAVVPQLQRKGLGSKLLSFVEENVRTDVIGAYFSRHEVMDFWFKNGYNVIYVSPRYNKFTGEKNLAVAKGLSEEGRREVIERSREFFKRFFFSLHAVYRDLDPKKVAKIFENVEKGEIKIEGNPNLKEFLEGRVEKESVFADLYLCYVKRLWSDPLLIGWLLQGKSVWDLAASLEGRPEEVENELESRLKELARSCEAAVNSHQVDEVSEYQL